MTVYPLPSSPAAAGTNNQSSNTTTGSANDTTDTFLKILVTELQSQDPTQPLDPNQMTEQIVSMNQLDQLISIHQLLQSMNTASTTKSK